MADRGRNRGRLAPVETRDLREVGAAIAGNLGQAARGSAAGLLGLPGDVGELMRLNPMWQDNALSMMPTTDEWGERLGADTQSGAFLAGQFLDPLGPLTKGLKGLGLLAGAIPLVRRKYPSIDIGDAGAVNTIPGRPRDLDVHKRFKGGARRGQYRGAPPGVKTPQALGNLTARYLQKMEEGAVGADWYDRASEAMFNYAGDRVNTANRIAGTTSITSAGTGVKPNTGAGIKAYNQALVGDQVNAGRFPVNMGKDTEKLFSGDEISLGYKRDPFYDGLTLHWSEDKGIRPTNDIWQARLWGFGDDWDQGLSEAQHRWIDSQMDRVVDLANKRKLGGRTDWTPERAQAAAWVAKKAWTEAEKKGRKATKADFDNAALDYADFMPDMEARITVEGAPDAGSGHLPGLLSNPDALSEYSQIQRELLSDEKGRDLISMSYGALTGPTLEGGGYWEGVSNPAFAIPYLSGKQTGSQIEDVASKKLGRGIAATHGLFGAQAGVGRNFAGEKALASKNRIADIDLGRAATQEDMLRIGRLAESLPELGKPGDDYYLTHTPRGARLVSLADEPPIVSKGGNVPEGFATGARKIAKSEKTKARLLSGSTDYIGADTYKPSSYLEHIAPFREDFDRIAPAIAERLDDLNKSTAKIAGATGQHIDKVLGILRSGGGLAGLEDAVRRGVLPAAALAAILGYAMPQGEPEPTA